MQTRVVATLVALMTSLAAAQPSAVVTITVDGQSSGGYATYNAPMLVRATLTWAPAGTQLASIRGSILVREAPGSPPTYGVPLGNFSSQFPAGPLVNHGTFSNASRTGMSFEVIPAFFTGGVPTPPSGNNTGIVLAEYTVFTNGPSFNGLIEWAPAPGFPNVRLYPSAGSPTFIDVPTTYVGATFTATPAPTTLATLCGVMLTTATRRRRA